MRFPHVPYLGHCFPFSDVFIMACKWTIPARDARPGHLSSIYILLHKKHRDNLKVKQRRPCHDLSAAPCFGDMTAYCPLLVTNNLRHFLARNSWPVRVRLIQIQAINFRCPSLGGVPPLADTVPGRSHLNQSAN